MASLYAFTVGPDVFFDPHPGTQLETVQRIAQRVLMGVGASKYGLRGNRGGGKSFMVRRGTMHALAMAIPGWKYAVVRRNLPDLHKNHLVYVGKEMRTLGGTFNETRHEARYANGSIGFYAQCEEEKDVEKVVGAEVAALFVDEAAQILWDYLRTMSPSLRVAMVDGKMPYWPVEIYGYNPIGLSVEELDRYFVDQDVTPEEDPTYDPTDWCHVPIHRADNPSLDETEYLKQFAGLPAHYRKAWVDGVRMESRTLFDVFPSKDGKPYHYINELPTIDGVPLVKVPWVQWYRAFDMGYYPDPAYCLWIAVVGRRVIFVRESVWFKTEAHELAVKIRQETEELLGTDRVVMTYVDPTIAIREGVVTVMDHLEMGGIPCEPSINDRTLYADVWHSLLGYEVQPGIPQAQIYQPGCPMLCKYLPKQRWDEKNPRKMADHKWDHPAVTGAYFGASSGVLSHAQNEVSQPRPVWMDWIEESTRSGRRGRRVSA